MRRVNIVGYRVLYASQYDYYIVLGQRIKIYDSSFNLASRLLEIKYPSKMKISQDGRYVYVFTTEMLLYEIDLSDCSVKRLARIRLSELTSEQNSMLETRDFIVLDGGNLLCLAGTIGAYCLILINISAVTWKAVIWKRDIDGECGTRKAVRLVEMDDRIIVVDSGFLSIKDRDYPSLAKEPLELDGVNKRIELVRYSMAYEKSLIKRLRRRIIELTDIVPEIDAYLLTDSLNTFYFIRPSELSKQYKLVLPISTMDGIDNAWYDMEKKLLYLSVNQFDSCVIIVSLANGIENPECVCVINDYMDCIACPEGLLLLSQHRSPPSCIVKDEIEVLKGRKTLGQD